MKLRLQRLSVQPFAWRGARYWAALWVVPLMATTSPAAWAALGDKPLAVSAPIGASSASNASASGVSGSSRVATLRAQSAVMASSGAAGLLYTVQTVVLETGTSVTEYVTASGVVFAVRWTGPVLPDYALVLGVHFKTFQDAALAERAHGKRGGSVGVNVGDLVVGSAGHMGSYQGYAYVPSLVPSGVDVVSLLS